MEPIALQIQEASSFVQSKTRYRPKLAVILGSGLGAFARELARPNVISYADIPHFPRSTVTGHAGRMVLGEFEGSPLCVLAGRVHAYEGYSAREVSFPVRVLAAIGIKTLVITNAAGAVNQAFRPGDLMVMTDHLNLTGNNPLIGPEEPDLGPRFPDMSEAYTLELIKVCETAALGIGLNLRKGVYAGLLGPSFETPAEIRMLRTLGADAVGMSTVLEVITANHGGMSVLGISCMTNMAAGILKKKLDHREVMETGERVRGVFAELLREVLPRVNKPK